MKNLAVFVSGSGSDLQSIIDGIESGKINAEIKLVVASKHGIYSLERAKQHNIPAKVFAKSDYENCQKLYFDLEKTLNSLNIDYIILAGYLSILPASFVKAFKNKIINIHPSLIPKYCGDGYYGMKVHEAVIKNKETESGATVHFVDEGTDTGAVIQQSTVKVYETDTAETLQKRVLEAEHKLLPHVVGLLCDDKIILQNNKVIIK